MARSRYNNTELSMPRADDRVQFATQVEPLFRQKDRQSMRRHFDLGSYEDVSAYADRILQRLRAGTMPCDAAWPPERIEGFDRWVRRGKLP